MMSEMTTATDCETLAIWLREHADKPTQSVYANQYRRIALLIEGIGQKNSEMRRSIEYARTQSQSVIDALGRHVR